MQTATIHHDAAQPMAPKAAPAASGSGPASSPSGTSTTITANDFLTLLVAEMKNQDPTSNQDPNAYINQLVQVNSLQQLIQINQDLGTSSSSTGTQKKAVSAISAADPNARAANTAAAVSAAEQQLKAEVPIDAASRLETALAPKNVSGTPSYWGSGNENGGSKAAGFQPLK